MRKTIPIIILILIYTKSYNQLLNTAWEQDGIYNQSTPLCDGENTLIGCGAIAVGQILNYYNYPNFPISYSTYEIVECPNEGIEQNYISTTKNIFSNTVDGFLYDVATLMITEFGIDGSTTYFNYTNTEIEWMEQLFENILDFDDNAYIINQNDSEFANTIAFNVSNCRPVLFRATHKKVFPWQNENAGHMFVIDDYDPVTNKFHMNIGWGDYYNDWYYLDDISPNYKYSFNLFQKALVGIIPPNTTTACNINSLNAGLERKPTNTKKKNTVLNCPNILYPHNNNLLNNRIQFNWSDVPTAIGYQIDVINVTDNITIIDNQDTYGGNSSFTCNQFFGSNKIIKLNIRAINNSGSIISDCMYNFNSFSDECDVNFNYLNKYCIDNGSEYVIEVQFSGNNTLYDLYADWDGTTYDSKDDITPGFYILGPFPINQNVGIIVEDISNPFNCFDTELVIAPPNPSNCVPNPISQNNGGSSQNPPVTCSVPSFNRSINGTVVTYSWSWPTNAQNIIIEKSLDQNIVFDSHVIPNNGTTSIAVSYAPCEAFYVRARVDCGQNFSNYTNYLNVDLSDISCNTPSCPFPTNVNHNIITSSNPDQLNVSWSNDGNSHEICFYKNGNQISCSVKPSNQTSTGIYIDDCENYDYKIRSVCGSDYSNWYNNNESIQTGNNCNALTDIRISSFGYIDITPTHVNIENLEIRNDGNYAVSNVKIELYLESASFSGPPIYVTEVTYAFLANETKNISPFGSNIQSLIPPNAFTDAVECNYLLVLDADGSVPERNESNNASLYIHQDIFFGCSDSNAYPGNYHASTNIEVCYYCNDGIKNGTESGVDCGGAFCPPCCNNIYYLDNDGDGFGNDTQSTIACTAPSGYVSNGIDCNDNNANIYPGNVESCDGIDNDCNTLIDECCTTYYIDNDEDGYGGNTTIQSCYQLFNYVTNNNDCDDNNANTNPGASEICDSLDNNCTGGVDEGSVCTQPGDYCTSAIQISNNNNYQFINSNGPNSGNGALNIDPSTASPELEHSDWYYFTPTEDGLVYLISCYYGIDTRLHVYSGDCNNLNYMATFDDDCELTSGGLEFASSGTFNVYCGSTYYIEWDDNWSESPFTFEFGFSAFNEMAPIISSNFLNDFEFASNDLLQTFCSDDFDWVQHTGITPSRAGGSQTGPVSAYEGDYYFYIESSYPNNPNKTAVFYTPYFDLSYFNIPLFGFKRHMYGNNVGTLTVEMTDDYGATWDQKSYWTGNYGDQWNNYGYFPTTNGNNYYANKTVQFRITATTGNGFEGDIAIDNITLTENCATVKNINFDVTYNWSYWEAWDLVKSNKKVKSNATATFDSGNRIELNAGFEVESGATFHAKIDGCDTNLNSLQNDNTIKK